MDGQKRDDIRAPNKVIKKTKLPNYAFGSAARRLDFDSDDETLDFNKCFRPKTKKELEQCKAAYNTRSRRRNSATAIRSRKKAKNLMVEGAKEPIRISLQEKEIRADLEAIFQSKREESKMKNSRKRKKVTSKNENKK